MTEDGGKTWRKTDEFASVPDGYLRHDVFASPRDANVVFVDAQQLAARRLQAVRRCAATIAAGRSRRSPATCPTRHATSWSIVQDHVNGNLLFAGTEFGLFFTVDGGAHWVQLKGGCRRRRCATSRSRSARTISCSATFGRGFYVLDDYSALRDVSAEALARDAELFPLRHAYQFDELTYPQAAWGNYTTPNPPDGATFTYHVGRQAQRQSRADDRR